MKKPPIAAIKHPADSRTNIPTAELRDFVAEDENAPKTMLYPRDTSLDPQLVWKGKDEQDSADLEVPVVPIYIQEKIHPQALIEDIRANAQGDGGHGQADLFGDFNGIDFEQLIEFYQHNHHWSNRMILGDSLQVMASLSEKEGMKGKVQMIYIDPPYGIKFGSNWQVSTRKREVKDGKAEDFTRQPEQIKAFRDTWELGIHSYLAYLRDRLQVAKELLTESGSVFVQIGDENIHLVRCLMDEIFGSENFVSQIFFQKTGGLTPKAISNIGDHILWYAHSKEHLKYRQLFSYESEPAEDDNYYVWLQLPDGSYRRMIPEEKRREIPLPTGSRIFRHGPLSSSGDSNTDQNFTFHGKTFVPAKGNHWKTSPKNLDRVGKIGHIFMMGNQPAWKLFWDYSPGRQIQNVWLDTQSGGFNESGIYVVQTTVKVIERCLLMTTDPGDLVLDPTCGSGTTAYVAEQWGRRWITTDTSRVALALARTRLMSAKFPYYFLADSEEGRKKAMEVTGKIPAQDAPRPGGDIKKGFVYKTVPHITLKSIANNPEIDTIHAKWQEKLEPLRTELNQLRGQSWEEWEIPREAETPWDDGERKLFARVQTLRQAAEPDTIAIAGALHALNSNLKREYKLDTLPERPADPWPEAHAEIHRQWWAARRERQREIDASIARNADTETLYDQPYEDKKRVRVTGPFTVESLSPHRVLPVDDDGAAPPRAETQAKQNAADFATMILDNLRKAGVQNTVKAERLRFDRLEPYAGRWLHAEGEYTEADGAVKRVAVSIGPEHGTVGAAQVKEASKEAVQGLGFDMLLVCGFAFDPSVTEEAKRYGKLVILPVKMNPDLAMGDDLLKKTGSGNLFMIFGEPDIQPVDPKTGKLIPQKDGTLQIEIKGLDIYDPTTGQIRSHSTADIACWFIDTNYNGESFFVRHAYFTGGDEPYEKLRKALKADIDEAAWEALYSTKSRPFPKPETGKIAVKVINHYGDEAVKVFSVKD
ncbi:site-specific DNA-methyltransferase [Methylomagnum ishizawai]|uniref:site-specific DNA-methyltransferase n=1 Tax=Methylomagnum ishizawai TaxID=1760988 RepID=UPI001C334D4F|nr:site-specific DNA-methyltransferase [Methylomagnum ishizawai]BBL77518.1 DNA methylase [Methylomagnum ishizawai]